MCHLCFVLYARSARCTVHVSSTIMMDISRSSLLGKFVLPQLGCTIFYLNRSEGFFQKYFTVSRFFVELYYNFFFIYFFFVLLYIIYIPEDQKNICSFLVLFNEFFYFIVPLFLFQ